MNNVYANRSFERIMETFRRRIWLGASVFLLLLALTLAFLWSLPQLYQASATLVVADSATGTTHSGPEVGGFAAYGPPPLDAVTEQVLSRGNLEGIITQLNLFPNPGKDTTPQGLVERMRKNIQIEKNQSKDSRGQNRTLGFTVSYNDWNPATAAAVANRLAKSYQTTAAQIRGARAAKDAAALADNMAVVRKKLAKQQRQIAAFNAKHIGELPQQKQVSLATLGHLYQRLQTDQTGELNVINQRANLLRNLQIQSTSDTGTVLSLAQLKQQLHDLELRYTDQYPDVIVLKRKIAMLENQQATNPAGGAASPLQAQLDQLDATLAHFKSDEKKVRAEIAQSRSSLESLPLTSQQLETLTQSNNQTNTVYAALLQRYEQARVVAATAGEGAPPYMVLEPALVPQAAAGPKRLRFAVILVILCALIAFAVVMIVEKRDTTFHSLEELREFTSVPVLTTVPTIRRRRDKFSRTLRTGALVAVLACGIAALASIGYAGGHGSQGITQILSGHGNSTSDTRGT